MDQRLIALVGACDQNGVFGIGPNLPWGDERGRSLIRMDMDRFVQITRKTVPEEGKQNVLILGRGTMEAMGWRPLPGRRTIVLSQTLNEKEVSAKMPEGKSIAVAHNSGQALERALQYEDCGHVFFGGGESVWLESLKGNLCNAAFMTVVHCDSVAMSMHQGKGDVRKLPELLAHDTFAGMEVESIHLDDTWGEQEVPLEFRNYKKK